MIHAKEMACFSLYDLQFIDYDSGLLKTEFLFSYLLWLVSQYPTAVKILHTCINLVVQFSCSVMSDSLQPRGLWHARLPYPSPTPGAYSNSYPSSQWCHPTISSSVVPFPSHLQSFPASGSFPRSQFFASGAQSIGTSASASVLPMNIQDLFPLGWTGWISCSPKDSQESSPTPQFKNITSLALSLLYGPTLISIHDYWRKP